MRKIKKKENFNFFTSNSAPILLLYSFPPPILSILWRTCCFANRIFYESEILENQGIVKRRKGEMEMEKVYIYITYAEQSNWQKGEWGRKRWGWRRSRSEGRNAFPIPNCVIFLLELFERVIWFGSMFNRCCCFLPPFPKSTLFHVTHVLVLTKTEIFGLREEWWGKVRNEMEWNKVSFAFCWWFRRDSVSRQTVLDRLRYTNTFAIAALADVVQVKSDQNGMWDEWWRWWQADYRICSSSFLMWTTKQDKQFSRFTWVRGREKETLQSSNCCWEDGKNVSEGKTGNLAASAPDARK